IVCVGDSITEYGSQPDGWVARLGWLYSRKADVVNRGFSGYTTRIVRDILPDVLRRLECPCARTTAVTLMLGSNDATVEGGFQHVPPEEFLANMIAICLALRTAFPAAQVFVITPPMVDGPVW
ncbi:SGNH hydrolase-type esterase domain-containing protein, partial [Pavlovales sp. CCMP2436]